MNSHPIEQLFLKSRIGPVGPPDPGFFERHTLREIMSWMDRSLERHGRPTATTDRVTGRILASNIHPMVHGARQRA